MTERTLVLFLICISLPLWILLGVVFVASWALHGHASDFFLSLWAAFALAKIALTLKELRQCQIAEPES